MRERTRKNISHQKTVCEDNFWLIWGLDDWESTLKINPLDGGVKYTPLKFRLNYKKEKF